ncbi:MAG: L-threonylcarbamoyladenylate synthase [Candidatus Omnitrophota bacterium]|nr:L-threonylcarbamoyladenylate synthase [Candidatus Omnitrophota bacterium]
MLSTKVIKVSSVYPEPKTIKQAAGILLNGGLVAFPTETVYGVGASFLNKQAIEKIYQIKKRKKDKPIPILVGEMRILDDFVSVLPRIGWKLINRFWPGPLTLILKGKNGDKIGFRMPSNRISQELLSMANVPIAVSSANISGSPSPTTAEEVLKDLNGSIDMLIDGGPTSIKVESTVVDLTTFPLTILREGALSKELIFKFKKIIFVCTGNICRSPMAEGLLRNKIKQLGKNKLIEIISVGVSAPLGMQASRNAVEVMKQEGIDISGHKSRPLDTFLIKDADLIFVMEPKHKEVVLANVPQAASKVHLLDISDPIGGEMEAYRQTLNSLKDRLTKILKLLEID